MTFTRVKNNKPAGSYTSKFLADNTNNVINGQLVSDWELVTQYDGSLIDPIWNGSNWVENESYTDWQERVNKKVVEYYTILRSRALSSSMGKYGTKEYLDWQREEYEEKYKIALMGLNDEDLSAYTHMVSSIEKEVNRDYTAKDESDIDAVLTSLNLTPESTKIKKFYQLIKFKYELAEDRFKEFNAFLVDFRAKVITLAENLEKERVQQCFDLADTIPDQLDMSQAQTLYDQFELI
jgi:hypothetical protein